MSDDQAIDLTTIQAPKTPASDQPDEATKREIKHAVANKLTPTQLHDRAREAHIQDICQERKQLQQNIIDQRDRFENEVAALRTELDRLRPEHAKLEEANSNTLAVNILSTVMVGLGGSLISGAGYTPNDVWKFILLSSGIAVFLSGSALQITATWRSVAFRKASGALSSPR